MGRRPRTQIGAQSITPNNVDAVLCSVCGTARAGLNQNVGRRNRDSRAAHEGSWWSLRSFTTVWATCGTPPRHPVPSCRLRPARTGSVTGHKRSSQPIDPPCPP